MGETEEIIFFVAFYYVLNSFYLIIKFSSYSFESHYNPVFDILNSNVAIGLLDL